MMMYLFNDRDKHIVVFSGNPNLAGYIDQWRDAEVFIDKSSGLYEITDIKNPVIYARFPINQVAVIYQKIN